MTDIDRRYFETRAEQEIELARSADHPRVVKAHYTLASLYLDRVHGDDPDGLGAAIRQH